MPPRLGVGFSLHPDLEYLTLTREIIENEADYFEVNPEAMWRPSRESVQSGAAGDFARLERNDYHRLFYQIKERSGRPFVAHGLAFSPATPIERDAARTRAWIERLRDDYQSFQFPWMSEHLGWMAIDGLFSVLPLPFLYNNETAAAVSARMRAIAEIVPAAAFENNVAYFHMEDPELEPDYLNRLARESNCHIMLDLHNVYTQCKNNGTSARDYVSRLDLDRVIQIHLSGGADSDAAWLRSGRVMRLDSHDGAIPGEVWNLYEEFLPKCNNIGGVVVERLNATFDASGVPALRDEVRRARDVWRCAFA
ncbi:MAG: DUF692 family protein [Planctomycetes bacterium]|nr:DUF692 family protein [Planctomycetota bacterium]